MKESRCCNVSVLINHHQDLEKMLSSVIRSQMFNEIQNKGRVNVYRILIYIHVFLSFLFFSFLFFYFSLSLFLSFSLSLPSFIFLSLTSLYSSSSLFSVLFFLFSLFLSVISLNGSSCFTSLPYTVI